MCRTGAPWRPSKRATDRGASRSIDACDIVLAESSTVVAFYIQKSLAHGPIRFGVAPRREIGQIDSDAALSTGPRGEFARKSAEGFFFAGAPVSIGLPTLPTEKSISSTPFWSSLRPDGTPKRL